MPPETEKRHWHLSKAVQLPVIFLVLVNICGSVWWAATIEANESAHYIEMKNKTANMITKSETKDKLEKRDISISNNSKNIERVYAVLEKLDGKMNRLLER